MTRWLFWRLMVGSFPMEWIVLCYILWAMRAKGWVMLIADCWVSFQDCADALGRHSVFDDPGVTPQSGVFLQNHIPYLSTTKYRKRKNTLLHFLSESSKKWTRIEGNCKLDPEPWIMKQAGDHLQESVIVWSMISGLPVWSLAYMSVNCSVTSGCPNAESD